MKDNLAIRQRTDTADSPYRGGREVSEAPANPTLESVIAAIRADATRDPLSFLLRSDTGHDGE